MDDELTATRDHRLKLRAERPDMAAEEVAVAMMTWRHGWGWLDPADLFEEMLRPVTPANDDKLEPGAG